jgi:transcriptional regulator with XRE-family HTH domain
METPIVWQAEARRMRARGKSSDEIAAQLGKTVSTIREVLRGTRRPPPETLGAAAGFTATHTPRTPRVILDQDMVRSAAADFAAGEIDRAELLRRISR